MSGANLEQEIAGAAADGDRLLSLVKGWRALVDRQQAVGR
jgi:hypothetical protein